jgi:sugar lactone lactonase YvrE
LGRRPLGEATVLFDGAFTTPRLDHPESVAVDVDGNIWCGGEQGQIYRLADDRLELIASTYGFTLGVAFLDTKTLAVCDMARPAVWLLDTSSRSLRALPASPPGHQLLTPNAVVPLPDGSLLVSDSGIPHHPRPGVVRVYLDGRAELWFKLPLDFANGMALSPDLDTVYVAESWSHRVRAIELRPDTWDAGASTIYAELGDAIPDGLCADEDGALYIGCYEPSQILRVSTDGSIDVLADDPTAHTLCHPTGVAVRGEEIVVANLGRWHLSTIARPMRPRD